MQLEPMTHALKPSNISIAHLFPSLNQSWPKRQLLKLIDKTMGLSALKQFYLSSDIAGLSTDDFPDALLNRLNVSVTGNDELATNLQSNGATIIVANHPFGCIEGIALANAASKLRPDVKVLANHALGMFSEIRDLFIFIDPLTRNNPKNGIALRACRTHLNNGGCLIIFPAGKTSEYSKSLSQVTDTKWNRLPAQLAKATGSDVLPVYFGGTNSRLFIRAGRIWSKFKLILLFRELLNKAGQRLEMKVGKLIPNERLASLKDPFLINDYLRAQVYLLAENLSNKNVLNQNNPALSTPETNVSPMQPIAEPGDASTLLNEIADLPDSQKLVEYKGFEVYYGYFEQMPAVVFEIARQRERVFRMHDEGSGEPIDTDGFDKTYIHLFIFDKKSREIIGAYRMGQTDKLIAASGMAGLYLNRMFEFKDDFINRTEPCLEMGRSFIVPEHQKSFYGLYLLWRGIGEFVVRHPQYRKLYGTVSISKLYNERSVDAINQIALSPSTNVVARHPFKMSPNKEFNEFLAKHAKNSKVLSAVVQGIESDNKDIPILMKHYQRMAANFYCIGIDKNFNNTPGLLLSVDLPNAPEKMLKQYLADGAEQYKNYEI